MLLYYLLQALSGGIPAKVSTRGRYALRAAIDLAIHQEEGSVLRQDLVNRQGFSSDYVAQLLPRLRAAGIVETVRGPGGGYRLARDPSRIRAGDVVQAMEGETAVVYCVEEPIEPPCPRSEDCVARGFWIELSEGVDRCMNSVTLAELAGGPSDQCAR